MRYLYLLFIIYVCECYDGWYQRYDDGTNSVRSYDYYRSSGSVDEDYFIDKQNNYQVYDDEQSGKGVSIDSGHEMNSDNDRKDKERNDKTDDKHYIESGYKNDDHNYGRSFDDNKKCRYIGPLYDFRMLNKFEYRSDEEYSRPIYWNRHEVDRFNDAQYDGKCRYDGKHDEIIHPCALNDWECIRKFMADSSGCKPAYGPAPDPMHIPIDKFFIPVVNLTMTHIDLIATGFESTKITEFYLNKDTGNLVIAIDVLNFNQSTPKSFFTYQRTAKEPIVLADFATVQYKKVRFMAVLPYYPHLRLDKAEIHADIESLPTYELGPGISDSKDPDVVSAFAQFNLNIPIVVQEAFTFQSFLLTATYIQKSICDFGIDVYGNYLRFLKSKGFVVLA